MVKSICHDPSRFNVSPVQVKSFERLIMDIDSNIFDGCIFKVSLFSYLMLSRYKESIIIEHSIRLCTV